MRKIITLLFLFVYCYTYAQNIGIGTATPLDRLHVDSNVRIGINAWTTPANNRFLKFGDGPYVTIGEVGLDDRLEFSAREFLFRNSGAYGINHGKVGINISSSPTAYLEVNGNVKITDGSQGVAKVLTSDAGGTATWQSIPSFNSGFHATRESSMITVSNNTETTIIFDTEQFDDGSNYNSTNGQYICPINGVYHFDIKIYWNLTSPTTPNLFVYLDVNGSHVEQSNDVWNVSTGTDPKTMGFGATIKINSGDVVKVLVKQLSASNQTVATFTTSFSGYRVY